MGKAFAEKILDTIYGNFQSGKKQMSWKQFNIVSEYLEHTPELPNGFIAGYYGNLGKYQIDIADERNTSANRITVIDIKLRDEDEVKAERKAEAEAQAKKDAFMESFRNGTYVGQPKKRMDLNLTLVSERQFDGRYGRTNCFNFADEQGNCIVWFTQNALCIYSEERGEWGYAEVGDKVTMRATIKEHSEYKGTKQTVVTRAHVKSISEA